jgi:hypothetical protein
MISKPDWQFVSLVQIKYSEYTTSSILHIVTLSNSVRSAVRLFFDSFLAFVSLVQIKYSEYTTSSILHIVTIELCRCTVFHVLLLLTRTVLMATSDRHEEPDVCA